MNELPTIQLITEEQFAEEVLQYDGKVLVDFFGNHCPPCRAMEPLLADIAREKPSIKFIKMDAANSMGVAARYRVSALPTYIFFENGQPTKQLSGARTKKQMSEWLQS